MLGEHRGRHGSQVSCVAYSPDGKMIASGGTLHPSLGPADDAAQGLLSARATHVTSVAFSRDSKVLVAGTNAGGLYVWDLQPGDKPPNLRASFTVASTAINAVAFAPNGKTVACACGDNATRLYDVTGKEAKEQAVVTGHTGPVNAVAYSPDGKTWPPAAPT